MSCHKIQNWLLSQYDVDSDRLPESIAQHISKCAVCSSMKASIDAMNRQMESMKELPVPEEISRNMWPTVAGHLNGNTVARRRSIWPVGISALAATAVLLAFFLRAPNRQPTFPLLEEPAPSLTIDEAKVDGEEVKVSVYEKGQANMTMIWLD